jgi:MFS family permease
VDVTAALRRARSSVAATTRVLRAEDRGPVLLVVAVGWLLVLGTRVVLPTLLPQVREAFGFDAATAGLLVSALWGAYALAQFPAGVLADRIGERRTLVLGTALVAAGACCLALAPTFPVFVVGAVAFGLGAGLYAPPRVTVLSRTYPDRDGTALGVTFALGNFGAAALPVVAGGLALWVGWRYGFGVMIVPLGLCVLGLWRFVPAGRSDAVVAAADPPRTIARRVVSELTDRTVSHAWLAMTLMLFTYQGLEAFLPTYLVAVKGVDPGTAATLFGLYFASGAIIQPFAGSAADRFGAPRVLAALAVLGVATLIALPAVEGIGMLTVVIAALGTRLGNGPVGNGYVAAVLSEEVKGSGYGLFRTIYMVVGALGSTFVGVLAGLGRFDEAFLALAAITAVAAVLYYLLPELDRDEPEATDARASDEPAETGIAANDRDETAGTDAPSSRTVEPGSDTGEEPEPDDVTD